LDASPSRARGWRFTSSVSSGILDDGRLVSLGGQPLAICYRNAEHARLNLCLRGHDNSHSFLVRRDKGVDRDPSKEISYRIEREKDQL
jgi:hypothetical protein